MKFIFLLLTNPPCYEYLITNTPLIQISFFLIWILFLFLYKLLNLIHELCILCFYLARIWGTWVWWVLPTSSQVPGGGRRGGPQGGHSIIHSFIHRFTYTNSLLHSSFCWLAYSFIHYFIKNSFLLCNNINEIQLILFMFEPALYNGMSLTRRKIRTDGNLNPPGFNFIWF